MTTDKGHPFVNYLFACLALLLFIPIEANAQTFTAPDGTQTYRCGSEKNSGMGCCTYWVKSVSPDLIDQSSDGLWRPAACSDEGRGLCYQGGVAWWYWSEGSIGDNQLKDFVHRDYTVPGNDNALGTALLVDPRKNCYRLAGRTFCMVPMTD